MQQGAVTHRGAGTAPSPASRHLHTAGPFPINTLHHLHTLPSPISLPSSGVFGAFAGLICVPEINGALRKVWRALPGVIAEPILGLHQVYKAGSSECSAAEMR